MTPQGGEVSGSAPTDQLSMSPFPPLINHFVLYCHFREGKCVRSGSLRGNAFSQVSARGLKLQWKIWNLQDGAGVRASLETSGLGTPPLPCYRHALVGS